MAAAFLLSPPGLSSSGWLVSTAIFSNPFNKFFLDGYEDNNFDAAGYMVGIAHNLTRFCTCAIIGILVSLVSSKHAMKYERVKFFIPTALFVCMMNVSNSVALKQCDVALTYVVKATIPVWTCLYCWAFEGAKYSWKVVVALFVACIGVVIASLGEKIHKYFDEETPAAAGGSINLFGLSMAILSCISQCAFNIKSKKAMKDSKVGSPMEGFFSTSILTAPILLTVYLVILPIVYPVDDSYSIFYNSLVTDVIVKDPPTFVGLIVILGAGISYFSEYGLNFLYVSQVTPVTFAITDIVRRLATIVVNAMTFEKKSPAVYEYQAFKRFSPDLFGAATRIWLAEWFGIFLSLSGATAYAIFVSEKVKVDKKSDNKKVTSSKMRNASSSTKRSASRSPAKKRGMKKTAGD